MLIRTIVTCICDGVLLSDITKILSLRSRVTICSSGFFFFQAEDGIRDLVRSRGLGDVYKRQVIHRGKEGRKIHRKGSANLNY